MYQILIDENGPDGHEAEYSPAVVMNLAAFLVCPEYEAWHNETWHLFRQPRYTLESKESFLIGHRPSFERMLDYAPAKFVEQLIGGEKIGTGHIGEHCRYCAHPHIDEHKTLGAWYLELQRRQSQ